VQDGQKKRKPLTAISIAQLKFCYWIHAYTIYRFNALVRQQEKFSTFVVNAVSITMIIQHYIRYNDYKWWLSTDFGIGLDRLMKTTKTRSSGQLVASMRFKLYTFWIQVECIIKTLHNVRYSISYAWSLLHILFQQPVTLVNINILICKT
jgi:hypothetical protein